MILSLERKRYLSRSGQRAPRAVLALAASLASGCRVQEGECQDPAAVCTFISDCGRGEGYLSPGECPGPVGTVCCAPQTACLTEDVECCHGSWASRPDCLAGALTCPAGSRVTPLGTCSAETGCSTSGGTVAYQMCCVSTGEYPNTCVEGACSCSSESSHQVEVCVCPEDQCFDGESCVPASG